MKLRCVMGIALLSVVFGVAGAAAETVVINFERSQGFPAAAPSDSGRGEFTDRATNNGLVTKWTNESKAKNRWSIDDGPGGQRYPDAPKPMSGTQIAYLGEGGAGVNAGALHLDRKRQACMVSFYWAWRGNGNPRPGGDAYLEVEYYDLFGKLIGREVFHGGIGDQWQPKFSLAKVGEKYSSVPLSKVVFKGTPPTPDKWHGTFFLDDITLNLKPATEMLTLIEDGRARCTVVKPDNADEWTNRAVEWLTSYIRKGTGVDLPVVSESQGATGTVISVGHTKMANKAGIDISDLKWDGAKVIVKGDVLYLIGRDSKMVRKAEPVQGARGTCRAVLTFLEDFCGVRWFIPTPMGEVVPKLSDIVVPKGFSKTAQPAFAYSDGRATYSPGFLVTGGDTPASIINNFRDAVTVWPGGHTYYAAVPEAKYGKTHPEYFALVNGKRVTSGGNAMMYGNHLCSSNPDVKRLLIEHVRKCMDEGTEWMSLGQEDGYVRCECPECEKLDDFRWKATGLRWEAYQDTALKDHPCERLFLLHKAVIDAVAKSHPDHKVILMAYAPTAWPSKKIEYFGDNVIIEVTRCEPEYLDAWKDKGAGLTANVYWFNHTCPMGLNIHATPREVAAKIRYLHEHRVVGLYQYGQINWGYHGPSYYVLGKTMGDPSLDYKQLVEDYCKGVFGKAARSMMTYYDILYTRLEQVLPQSVEDFSSRNIYMPKWIDSRQMYLMMYPPSVLKRMEKQLDDAAREAESARAKGWVRHARDCFDFTKYLTRALIAHRAWQAAPSERTWQELKDRVEEFDKYRDRIINYPKSYTDKWFPAYDHFANYITADTKGDPEYYIPWEKRKPGVLKKGVRGMAIGFGDSYYHSFVKEPLTFDFDKPMPKPK